MSIYTIIACAFGAGVIYNSFLSPRSWDNIYLGSSISAMMLLMHFWLSRNKLRQKETLQWILTNKDLITDEEQYFRDSPFPMLAISNRTKFRNFKVVTSTIIVTTTHDIGGDLRLPWLRCLVSTVWSLIFGWWAIPWGPLHTVHALAVNLTGGEKQTLQEVKHTAAAALELLNNNG